MMSDIGSEWTLRVQQALSSAGINVWGVADGADYQALLPCCRSVLVFGNGGTALWDRFVSDLLANPSGLRSKHPLDDFVRCAIERADPKPPPSRRWIRCAPDEANPVDFRVLGRAAGLVRRSMLGLGLNPTYGPWLAFRAACFIVDDLEPSAQVKGAGPCTTCPAPCVNACPAGAVNRSPDFPLAGGWNVQVCSKWNTEKADCTSSCASRLACPLGVVHRYSALQQQYHYNRKTGRKALAAHLGLIDGQEGVGPHWKDWVDR